MFTLFIIVSNFFDHHCLTPTATNDSSPLLNLLSSPTPNTTAPSTPTLAATRRRRGRANDHPPPPRAYARQQQDPITEKIVLEGRVAMEHKTGEGIVLTSETKYKSKKRGLSLEEKREKMLQIFYDSQDFFLLKELEKLGPKKGVISQSVKDVIQSLVDDDLVLKDKIGSSIYFWSLPSTAGNQLRNVRSKLESELKSIKKRFAELSEKCNALKKGREESDEREEALNELKSVESKYKQLKDEMAQYADNDPAAIEEMRKAVEVAYSAANRWTDNIFTLRQWCSNNFPQAKEQLENMYREAGVTDDFDYLELPALSSVCITEGQK